MAKELKVYLDRQIPRDNLLYKSSSGSIVRDEAPQDTPTRLYLKELFGEDANDDLLRKPDFQRATSAWTPKECVDLLYGVLNEQIIPSIIMWRSPDNHWYVLDGSHRLSVVLAWIRDDWGDTLSSEEYMDEELETLYKHAAQEVKTRLAKANIKKFEEYQKAFRHYSRSVESDVGYPFGLDKETAELVTFYRAIKGSIVLPLQWVTGNYDKAKESFLNINKSGRKLTEWERKLVEHRDSSLARTVMSVTTTSSAAYCWPNKLSPSSSPAVRKNVSQILEESIQLHKLLFEPPYDPSFHKHQQPLLVESRTDPDTKAAYLAEILTVVKGHTGTEAQTEKLLKDDQSASEADLVKNGLALLNECIDVCNHLIGPSFEPSSLSLVPALYFYSSNGKHIRSLLYGFIYWLFYGIDSQDAFTRKLLFSSHRAAFERILLEKKQTYSSEFSRMGGSGSEVTLRTAKFYNGLLGLLIKHQDNMDSASFKEDYEELLLKKQEPTRTSSGKSRLFSPRQKAAIALRTWLTSLPKCGICGGILDLAEGVQYDHAQEHSEGGGTVIENGRPTHPFCNNNRRTIERISNGQDIITLPAFINAGSKGGPEIIQLSFLTEIDYDNSLSSMSE